MRIESGGKRLITLTFGKAADALDWLDRGVQLAGALAWPLAVLVIALLFRVQVVTLVARLDELRWGNTSARFSRKLDRLERRALASPAPPVADTVPELALSGDHARFLQLLELSPGAAVIDAWARVEEGVESLRRRGKSAALPRPVRSMLAELGTLREQAAHNGAITIPDALRFRSLAKRVLNEINLL